MNKNRAGNGQHHTEVGPVVFRVKKTYPLKTPSCYHMTPAVGRMLKCLLPYQEASGVRLGKLFGPGEMVSVLTRAWSFKKTSRNTWSLLPHGNMRQMALMKNKNKNKKKRVAHPHGSFAW